MFVCLVAQEYIRVHFFFFFGVGIPGLNVEKLVQGDKRVCGNKKFRHDCQKDYIWDNPPFLKTRVQCREIKNIYKG